MAVIESELSNTEEFYFCQMFGESSRFVESTMTRRNLRLSGRLEVERLSYMAWTTLVIIDPGVTHVWRFLGGDCQNDFSLLTLLHDPYLLAWGNSFKWTAEFVDKSEEESVTFDNRTSALNLQTLSVLQPYDRLKITL